MSKQIKGLYLSRYGVTELRNVAPLRFFAHPSLVTFTVTMSATYEQLINAHMARLQKSSNPDAFGQVSKNHMTALRAFMRHHQKAETTSIGPELGEAFDAAVQAHLADTDLSDRSRADRRSLLNAWRVTFIENGLTAEPLSRIKARRTVATTGQTPFEAKLKESIKQAKTTAKTAARRAGTSPSAIQRWMNGAIPNVRTVPNLARLDAVLKLEPGTLAKALAETTNAAQSHSAYRERLSELHRDHYCLKPNEVTPEFMQEWRRFFDYKTSTHPGALERNAAGRWSLTDARLSAAVPTAMNSRGNAVCASANVAWGHLESFFGFLRMPIDKGGYGVDALDVQALAWLADAQALDSFFRFKTDRSGGVCHTGHSVFATFVISLTHPKTGYLTQSPTLFTRLPDTAVNGRTPAEMCNYAYKMAGTWKVQGTDKSRNPIEPIRNIIELEEPLAPIMDAMGRLRRVGNAAAPGSSTELLARRDELILGLLVACPLRAKNMETLTYHANNSGSFYRTATGQWRIRIALANLKNGDSKRGNGAYDIPVAAWLNSRLDDYVNTVRPKLVSGSDPGYLLLTEGGARLRSFPKLVAKLTRGYITGCMGFGPHSFRHIVATDWLKKHPNDFLTVSELLGDTVETVIREYAHLKVDVAFSRYEAYVSALL